MNRLIWTSILGILLLAFTGCGGGGGGGGGDGKNTIDLSTPGNYPINVSYSITKNGATITFLLESIDVDSYSKLKLNCIWSAAGDSLTVVKDSDSNNTNMYFKDDRGTVYNHYQGSGAAYKNVSITGGQFATGIFYFPAINSSATSITFYDDDQGKTIGPISIAH
jgi:hypothetical protein